MESSFTHLGIRQLRSALVSKQVTTYNAIYKKRFFYRLYDRGAHLLTADIWEQPNYFPAQQDDERFQRGIPFLKKKLYYWFNVGLIAVLGFSITTHKIEMNTRNKTDGRHQYRILLLPIIHCVTQCTMFCFVWWLCIVVNNIYKCTV